MKTSNSYLLPNKLNAQLACLYKMHKIGKKKFVVHINQCPVELLGVGTIPLVANGVENIWQNVISVIYS